MSHAIIRGTSGRRHEVDFGSDPVTVSVHASDETIALLIEADHDRCPPERRRFALVSIPRAAFSKALADAGRGAALRSS